jgi:hypothetical protein
MENQHPVLSKMNEYIKDLEAQATGLNQDNLGMAIRRNDENENIRLILLEAIAEDVDVQTVANSVADVLGISLLKSVTVSMVMNVEATMVVPADYDISNLEIGDVQVHCYNSDVEDFSIESFDILDIEEVMYT